MKHKLSSILLTITLLASFLGVMLPASPVNATDPAIHMTSSKNPSVAGEEVTFTVTVEGATTGWVIFNDDGVTVNLNTEGQALSTVKFMKPGDYFVYANYYDGLTPDSRRVYTGQHVGFANPTVTLTSSANPSIAGNRLGLRVAVSGAAGKPTGTVTFEPWLGTFTLNSAGMAYCLTDPLAEGSYQYKAYYSGDSVYTGGISAILNQSVIIDTNPLKIVTAHASDAALGVPYSQQLEASGGSGSGYTWDITGGDLPHGLDLSSDGMIAGNPDQTGSFYFQVEVEDSAGYTAAINLSIRVRSDIVVYFPDPNLEAVIRELVGKSSGDIYQSDLLGVTEIDGYDQGIYDLTGLEYCVNLQSILLNQNHISDVSPLAGLVRLNFLSLGWNRISDISSLGGLTNLMDLSVPFNQIGDISVLERLNNLQYIWASNNQISDISPLGGLNLNSIDMDTNQISDISCLANFPNLQFLYLGNNNISDISSLAGLTSLEDIWMNDNDIVDITALSGLANLGYLSMNDNEIQDISALSGLLNLTMIDLNYNKISDLSPLVANSGIGAGDSIGLELNYLDNPQAQADLVTLKARCDNVWAGAYDYPEDANPVAYGQEITTSEGTPIQITLTGADADDGTADMRYQIGYPGPTYGALSTTPDTEYTILPDVTYTPEPGFYGRDIFAFRTYAGGEVAHPAYIVINVTRLNSAPVAVNQDLTIIENSSQEITLSAIDADSLTYRLADAPRHGSLSSLSGNQVVYTPNSGYVGMDSFKFKAFDGKVYSDAGTVTIAVSSNTVLPGVAPGVGVVGVLGFTGKTAIVHSGSPVTFSYESGPDATAVEININLNDGGSNISGNMAGGPPAWQYTTNFYPRTGKATVSYIVHYAGNPDVEVEFSLYVDPAGYVYDIVTSERIAGALVYLQRPDGLGGWVDVPAGESPAVMLPDQNPLVTGASGQYQWDTLPGTYRVRVEAEGYELADSIEVTVPPPVFDLHVGLIPLPGAGKSWQLDSSDDEGYLPGEPFQMEDSSSPANHQSGSVAFSPGDSFIWLTDQAASGGVTFPNGAWTVKLTTADDWSNNPANCQVELGYWDGTFHPYGITGESASIAPVGPGRYVIEKKIQTADITVLDGHFLALRITGNEANHTIYTAEGLDSSCLISPDSEPDQPIPELAAGILLGLGLAGLTGFVIMRKRKPARIKMG